MKNILFSILLLFVATESFSQQDALYSQYMFNQFTINPAYAGSRGTFSSVLLYRNQWTGLDGAPSTLNFSMHTPFSSKKMALGMNFIVDHIGPTKNSSFMGTYAYHLKTSKGKLSLALRGGIYSSTVNNNLLNFFDGNDVHNSGGVSQSIAPNFDFGVYYYSSKFYSGLSVNHLYNSDLIYQNTTQTHFALNRHIFFNTGGVFILNSNLVFKPSLMIRYVNGSPISYDLNSAVLLNKKIWIGLTYRSTQNLVFISEFNLSDYLRAGYSYDFDLSKLRSFHSGSHEVFIGCDLNFRKVQSKSPRYL